MPSEKKDRWYDPVTKECVHEVKKAKGDGMTKVTLRQARPRGFLPSITSVLKILSSYSLQSWIIDNTIKTCVEYKYDGDKSESSIEKYIAMICAKAGEYAGAAADAGQVIHGANAEYLINGVEPEDPVVMSIVGQVKEWLEEQGMDTFSCETSLVSKRLGFAGTPDIVASGGGRVIIPDLKTTIIRKGFRPYDSWRLQLGGYKGLVAEASPELQGAELWQIVADRDSGETLFIPHENPEAWWNGFQHLYEVWVMINGYDPRMA